MKYFFTVTKIKPDINGNHRFRVQGSCQYIADKQFYQLIDKDLLTTITCADRYDKTNCAAITTLELDDIFYRIQKFCGNDFGYLIVKN